jgi:hypothetical protein
MKTLSETAGRFISLAVANGDDEDRLLAIDDATQAAQMENDLG